MRTLETDKYQFKILEIMDVHRTGKTGLKRLCKKLITEAKAAGMNNWKFLTRDEAEKYSFNMGLNGVYLLVFKKENVDVI